MSELRNMFAYRWDFDRGLRESGWGNPFPRGITHADVDAEIEIGGHFLVIEGKRTHERLTGGQLYAMRARVEDGRTCLIVYGCPEELRIDYLQQFPRERYPATWETYHRFCAAWAEWAQANSKRKVAA